MGEGITVGEGVAVGGGEGVGVAVAVGSGVAVAVEVAVDVGVGVFVTIVAASASSLDSALMPSGPDAELHPTRPNNPTTMMKSRIRRFRITQTPSKIVS